jgi:DNA invertase Pin-like site-specific DNA recombinase
MQTAIYARVSTSSEDQANALDQQLTRLRSRAEQLACPVVEFVDVMSGTRDDRPQLALLMEAVESGQIGAVICTRLDRMSRSTVHGGKLLRLFSQPNWPNLICLDQPIDLSTPGGRFFASVLMGLAQMESENIGERVHHGQMHARAKGKPQAGKPPYGYRYTEGKANYAIDPVDGPKARLAIEHFLEHGSVRELLRWSIAELGTPWKSYEGVRRWIQSPALTGARCYGSQRTFIDAEGNKRRVMNPPGVYDEVIPGAHPPLMSQEELAKIRAVLKCASTPSLRPLRKRLSRVLTGLVFCGHCNRRMTHHHPNSRSAHYMRCAHPLCPAPRRNSMTEEAIEEKVLANLKGSRRVLATHAVAEELERQQLLDPEVLRLQAQLSQWRGLGDPDLEEVIARKELELQQRLLSAQQQPSCGFTVEQAVAALEDERTWRDLTETKEKLRLLFSQWVDRVTVTSNKITNIQLRTRGGGGRHQWLSLSLAARDPK